jgi:Holliday junction DNA helicase RuvA
MLGYISGVIKDRQSNELLILAGGASSGVGYIVKTPEHPRYDTFIPGQPAEVYIYTHVREDALDLYGFLSAAEKQFFMTLLSVSGVGPKMALGMLSSHDEGALIQMILEEDKQGLTNISGLGKKTAERIVLELKDTIQKKIDAGLFGNARGRTGSGATTVDATGATFSRTNPLFIEAYLALQSLGYKEIQAKLMVEGALKKLGKPDRVEDIIKQALQG